MILFLGLILIVIGIFAIRSQSARQHWELLSAVNPDKLREMDEKQRAHNRVLYWIIGIPIGIILIVALYYQITGQ